MISPDARRSLTARERAVIRAHKPLLQLWTRYLTHADTVRTLADGLRTGYPVLCRSHRREAVILPVLVAPRLVMQWVALNPGVVPADLHHMPGPMQMAQALEAMGAEHGAVRLACTQRPAGEPEKWRSGYRHQGWWQMSGEVYTRLCMGVYVPVLARMPGRPSRSLGLLDAAVHDMSGGRASRSGEGGADVTGTSPVDRDVTMLLLRDYLSATDPTLQIALARGEGRPLVLRGRGRAPRDPFGVPPLAESHRLVHAEALAGHARAAVPRLEGHLTRLGAGSLAWMASELWTPEVMTGLLSGLAAHSRPELVEAYPRFCAVDEPMQTRHGGGWFRVAASLGGPGRSGAREDLADEWREWVAARDRAAEVERDAAAARQLSADDEWFEAVAEGPEETAV